MAKFFAGLFLILLDIPAIMLRGLVISYLWLWFMVPLGLMEITFVHGIGLALMVGLFLSGVATREDKGESTLEKMFSAIINSVIISLTVWGFGYIIWSFM